MKQYITLLMCIAIAIVSVACNLSTSAGANVELTQPADQLIPTATDNFADVVTEEPIIETEEPDIVVEQPANNSGGNSGQLPATAVLPEVTLPLIQPLGQPPATECTVTPVQSGTLVNVRRGAGLTHEAFMHLKTYASVMAEVNGWYQIPMDGGFSGYVSKSVTTLQGNCAFLNPPPSNLCSVRPSQAGGVVNVRRGADSGYEVIMQLTSWAVVNYEVNDWYGIDIEGPHDGFVSSSVTTLEGDCAFLHPTPIPTRDSSKCYIDIPLAAGIEVPYFSEPQRYGNQKKGMINTTQLLIRGEKAGWYDVISYQGTRGWVPATMGNVNFNCDKNNIPSIDYTGTICIMVAFEAGYAYYTPFTGSDQFGPVSEGIGLPVVAKTVSNWYGYDNSGNIDPTAEPISALRWVRPNEANRFYPVGDCDDIPTVYDETADWDIAIETAGEPPTDGCSVQSVVAPWVNYIFTGVDFKNRTTLGVLNTYAPFVAIGDLGYVIELPDGTNGWVIPGNTKLVGSACPV